MRYDMSRLSVLLVEDSMFMRSILRSVMQALGIGRIRAANDGGDAIQFLQRGAGKATRAIGTGIDIVIADLFMPKVDGLMLLRWIRRHEGSPDRFVPVIMISGMTDRESLEAARDAGVTEFVSKPFSVDGLAKRILQVIDHPRQFVYTPTYFGPDRRRRKVAGIKEERRKLREEDCEIVYSGKDPGSFREDRPKVWLFRLKNRLKEKLTGGVVSTEEGEIDAKLLELAREQIANMEEDYADWVEESIVALIKAHRRASADPEGAAEDMRRINEIAHELRGQGGLFGYPLMTEFGRSLYEVTRSDTPPSPQLLEIIKAHIDGIRAVMGQRIKGDGGALGKELMKSLEAAKRKYGGSGDAALSRAAP